MKKKFDIRNLILLIISIGFSLAILEVGLRIFMSVNPGKLNKYYQSNEYLTENKYWKIWHFPNNETYHKSDCFEARYATNRYGLKDQPVTWQKPRIALLGDSYVEGYGASNSESAHYYMDSLLNHQYEVLNFGTSGGFGTVHELAQYENFVQFFEPEIVILFFLNYNDLYDNLKAIDEGYMSSDHKFTYPKASSFERISSYLASKSTPPEKTYREGGLMTIKYINRGFRSLGDFIQVATNTKLFDFRTPIAEMYVPEKTDAIEEGYAIFRQSAKKLKELVEADSSQLIIVQIADPFQVDEGWLSVSGKKLGQELEPDIPNNNIRAICEELDIPYLDLYPKTKKYIEENQLNYPFLYHGCDRHHNALGNQVMAEFVADYLKSKDYLKK